MFPLFTNIMPESAKDLERLLNESLQRLFTGVDRPVSVRDKSYPQLAKIQITLDRAQLRADPPPPPTVSGKGKPGLDVA